MLSADDLRALDLDGVSVTAEVNADGTLGRVGGLWEKFGPQLMDLAHRRLLHTVVVADEQGDVPDAYLEEDAEPLRVLKAKSLAGAVRQLLESGLPRRAVRLYEHNACQELEILDRRVPIDGYYQGVPLLHEVKRERLPRSPRWSTEGEDPERALHPGDIVRWEEEVRTERVTYGRPTAVAEVLTDFHRVVQDAPSAVPRLVVMGPLGSGKTTLVQYLAWRAACGSLQVVGRPLIPARVRLRAWEAWVVKPMHPEVSLPAYLAEHYKDLRKAPTAEQWRRWLQQGEVLLLLDGLDEIDGSQPFLAALTAVLTTFQECPTVLTCRTVSYEQHKTVCTGLPVFTLASFNDTQRDAYIHAFPAEHPEHFTPTALIDHLNRTPQLHFLAATPLLLALLCYVLDAPRGVSLPATRAHLYAQAVDKLLTRRPRRVEVTYPGGKPDLPLSRKRRILERAALTLFAGLGPQRHLTFAQDHLLDALTQGARAEELAYPADVADSLLVDLTHNSGLLRGDPQQGYFFLHLTLHEFLAAAALARQVNEGAQGWASPLQLGATQRPVRAWVDKKAWDPRWQEVLVLLLGQVHNPLPGLARLCTPAWDDVFRHRLCLAARCLPELVPTGYSALPRRQQRQLHALSQRIAREVLALWWHHCTHGLTLPHIAQCLPCLAQGSPATVFPVLLHRLRGTTGPQSTRAVRQQAAQAFEHMGAAAAQRAEVPVALLEVALHDADPDASHAAWQALRRIGAAAARFPEVQSALMVGLRDPDKDTRRATAQLLSEMEEGGAWPAEVCRVLAGLARHDAAWEVRAAAIKALGTLGERVAQHAEILGALVDLALHDADQMLCNQARLALGNAEATRIAIHHDQMLCNQARLALGTLGERVARHAKAPWAFVDLALHDADQAVRWHAVLTLGAIDAAAVRYTQVPRALVVALHEPDKPGVTYVPKPIGAAMGEIHVHENDGRESRRSYAVLALGAIGEAVARGTEGLRVLVDLARHDAAPEVREQAVWVLGVIGKAAAQEAEVPRALVEVTLRDADSFVRATAAWALGRMGVAAAQEPAVVSALVAALSDTTGDERLQAAEVLGSMGAAAAWQAAVLPALVRVIRHEADESVRAYAAVAAGWMGAAAAQEPAVVSALVAALHSSNREVRARGLDGLEGLGAAAAQHPEVPLALLEVAQRNDPSSVVQGLAVKVLGKLGEAAARHPAVLPALVDIAVHEADTFARLQGNDALKRLRGAVVQRPEVLLALVAAWRECDDEHMGWEVAGLLEALGDGVAQQPEVLRALETLLSDVDSEVRWRATLLLERIGERVAQQPAALSRVAHVVLHHIGGPRPRRREPVLEKLGEVAVHYPKVLGMLMRVALYYGVGSSVRRAVIALGELGAAAGRHPAVLTLLMRTHLCGIPGYHRPGLTVSEALYKAFR